ncbi:MAG: type II toxin-antitoxin system HicB family antitoxin [Roseomonas sp.]|nr:type II toxin-antitoxin system HicB family antitoxin [Roseomonas sp.]
MANYVALVHKQPTSDYGVSFPDFPGCVTAGVTFEEAHRQAGEALALHIDGMIEDGEAVPEPSSLEHVMTATRDYAAVVLLVPAPAARSVRDDAS